MKPELYDQVHQLSLDIVNASANEDTRAEWAAYQELSELCEKAKGTEHDHPLQWEALGDFTTNYEQAINIYNTAVKVSEKLGLDEYSASINLAVAIRFYETGQKEQAIEAAHKANEIAATINNKELRLVICEFLLSVTSTK